MKHHFTAVILDMDGLLLDTEPVYKNAWQHAAHTLGLKLSDQLCDEFSGNSLLAIEERLKQLFGAQFDFDRFMRLSTDHWHELIATHGVQPMPGADLLLKKLQDNNISYALATNSPAHIADHCLVHASLEKEFSIRVTSNEVAQSKPAPDIYLLAMQKLNTPAHQCLCVEDSLPGIQAAHLAGGITAMISINNQPDNRSKLIDYRFTSLSELAQSF